MSVLDRTHASRAAAVVPTVAQSPQIIFTVSGGRVLVQALVGEVVGALDGTAFTLKITSAPTVGTPVDLSAALTMTSFAAGVHVTLGATVGAALSTTAPPARACCCRYRSSCCCPPGRSRSPARRRRPAPSSGICCTGRSTTMRSSWRPDLPLPRTGQ